MSSSVSFYTSGNMIEAVCDSATSEALPRQNLMDFNPDTYWQPTSSAGQALDINLTSTTLASNAFVLWHQNYTLSSTVGYDMLSSTDDISYFSRATGTFGGSLTTQPIRIVEFSEQTARYWRLNISQSSVCRVSFVWLLKKYTISQGNEWPENDLTGYHNRQLPSPSGRTFVQGINSRQTESFTRTYQLDQTKWDTLLNVFNESRGSRFPLFLQEGSGNGAARLVRFAQDEIDKNAIDYQIYRPTVRFVTVPYIPSGSAY